MKKLLLGLAIFGTLFAQNTIRLADVKKIYIEKMNNGLDDYLRAAISKKFHGSITLVTDRSQADAIMSAPNMHAQQTETATIDLKDPKGDVVLWSGSASDRDGKFLGVRHGGKKQVAEHLASDLKKAMEGR